MGNFLQNTRPKKKSIALFHLRGVYRDEGKVSARVSSELIGFRKKRFEILICRRKSGALRCNECRVNVDNL
jgi:hypothetical protein